jgi:diketogulonate reductase-like aldo/keto reductase
MVRVPHIQLGENVAMPQIGFGVFKIERSDTAAMVLTAFEAGYRHIDTAQVYANEVEVGEAIAASGLPRQSVFVTTKLYPDMNGYDSSIQELDRSLERLKIDYVDLYLIHHPGADKDQFLEAWRAMERLKADGKTRSIGVSNLGIGHLRWLAERSDTRPAINQVEIHPYQQQQALRAYHRANGIASSAWGALKLGAALSDPLLARLAERYGKSPAQITLRWHIQVGNVALVKSLNPARMRENIEIFDFELSAEDMAGLSKIDRDPDGAHGRIVKGAGPMWQP